MPVYGPPGAGQRRAGCPRGRREAVRIPSVERALVFVSGFGPFEDVASNPSARLARALAEDAPEGVRVVGAELPVSFERAPAEFDRALAGLDRVPTAVLALGVHRGAGFRLERRAGRASPGRPDADGVDGASLAAPRAPERSTDVDVERVAALLRGQGFEAYVSDDAGGYVCERLYRHALDRRADDGPPVLFVHVPHERWLPLVRQHAALARVVAELARQAPALKARAR